MRGSRRPRLVLLVLVLGALTLTALDGVLGGPLRSGADRVLGPLQTSVGGAVSSVGEAAGRLTGGDPDERVAALEQEVARLRGELATTEDDRRRVAELDALLALRDAATVSVVPARVVALGPEEGFERTALLDAGSDDGVRPGQTVVTGDGLVGRTTRVGPRTTTVLLLVDPGFSVGARQSVEGTLGIVRGAGGSTLSYTQVEGRPVAVGEALVTAGSGTFVPGIPVGRVTSVEAAPGALTRTAEVEPFVDVGALDLVGVVVEGPRGTPRVPLP